MELPGRYRALVASKVSLIHWIFALSCSVHLVSILLWGVSLLLSLFTFPWDNSVSYLFAGLDKSFSLNGMEFSCCSQETKCHGNWLDFLLVTPVRFLVCLKLNLLSCSSGSSLLPYHLSGTGFSKSAKKTFHAPHSSPLKNDIFRSSIPQLFGSRQQMP